MSDTDAVQWVAIGLLYVVMVLVVVRVDQLWTRRKREP